MNIRGKVQDIVLRTVVLIDPAILMVPWKSARPQR
jgi:hypothetical protein